MGLSLSNLSDLPGPAKVVVLVASGAAVTGLLRAFNVPYEMVLTLVIGMIVLAFLIAGFRWLLKKRAKTKGGPFLGKLLGAAGGTPQGLADPAKRARLDDLRKKFQEGVEKFKSSGKDIYALPWYLIVGPSGSGKTEAIRHCNVGFPPGLQDYLQGAGGTLNMHWWFTNHAVIVDTAGKMFMEEAKAGESSEWKEFLKLLKESRPLTPINGMLLCIGVDSLIRDSAEEISDKAAKIARQLDVIQRTLDVRFPVFVVVTKCDLITGFREFFENVNDPQLQHQMLGWSNPSALDEAFNPELVDQHVELVRQRLLRRRLALIIDPVHTDDPQARRTDQVDAMFALPESLSRLSSRLQRYLQLIFMAGEWSPKPLFLRGIYFTSSMRQGAELDEELAKIMGVPVENLPGGGVSEEKSYFLRDVFMSKVFREKGLVTRATNVKQQQRGRKLVIIGTGIGTVAVLLIVTVLSLMNFKKTVSKPTEKWRQVHEGMDGLTLVRDDKSGATVYQGKADVRIDGEDKTPVDVLTVSKELAGRPPSAPLVVKPFATIGDLFSGDPAEKVRAAHAALLERTALHPLMDRARKKMASISATAWNDDATGVLAGLLSIERGEAPPQPRPVEKKRNQEDEPPAMKVEWPVDTARFLAFVLPGEDGAPKAENAKLQEVVTWTYSPGSDSGKAKWPPVKTLDRDPIAVERGVKAFNTYWLGAAVQVRLGELDALRNEFKEFVTAEDALAATVREFRAKNSLARAPYNEFRQKWDGQFAALQAANVKVEARLKRPDFDVKKLDADIKNAEESLRAQADESYRIVLGEAPPNALLDALKGAAGEKGKVAEKASGKIGLDLDAPKWPGDLEDLRTALVNAREKVRGKDGIGSAVASLRDYFTTGDGGKLLKRNSAQYAATARFQAYERANAALVLAVGKPGWGELGSGSKQAEEAITGLSGEVRTRMVGFEEPSLPKLSMAKDGDFDFLMNSATRDARARVVRSVVESGAPGDPGWVKGAVARLASDSARTTGPGSIGGKYLSPIVVPLTVAGEKGIGIDPAYHPDAAKALFGDLKYLSGLYGSVPAAPGEGAAVIEDPGLSEKARTAQALIAAYGVEYFQAWTGGILTRLDIPASASWSEFRQALGLLNGQEESTSGHLRRLCELMTDALSVQGLVVADGKVKKESVDQWVGKIQGDLGPTLDIGKRLREDRANWFGLGQTGTDAQAKMGGLRADQFQSDYLQGFGCESTADGAVCGPATRYVNLLRLRALRTLGDELDGARQDILRRLDQYRRLPMRMTVNPDRGAADALSPEQVKEFRAKMPVGQRAVAGGESLIGHGGQTSHQCVNEQLDRVFGRKGFGAQELLFGSLNAWLPWVLGERGDVSFELQVMPDTGEGLGKEALSLKQQGIANAQGVFRQTEATFGSASQRRADEEAELSPSLIKDVPLPVRTNHRLKLTFSDIAGGGGRQGTREVSSVWSVLELLAEPDAEPYSPAGSAGGSPDRPAAVWRVPVVFSPMKDGQPERGADGKPQKFYKWILVKFSSEVPAKSLWPTEQKWQ